MTYQKAHVATLIDCLKKILLLMKLGYIYTATNCDNGLYDCSHLSKVSVHCSAHEINEYALDVPNGKSRLTCLLQLLVSLAAKKGKKD